MAFIHCQRKLALLLLMEVSNIYQSLPIPFYSQPHQTTPTRPAHVLLLADPHFLDKNMERKENPWIDSLTRSIVHLNLRKSWNAVSRLHPDAVFVLGDMLDNGRGDMTDEQYVETLLFRGIFD